MPLNCAWLTKSASVGGRSNAYTTEDETVFWQTLPARARQTIRERKLKLYALHKSLGLTVLALTALRLLWRMSGRVPTALAGAPRWQTASGEWLVPLAVLAVLAARGLALFAAGLFKKVVLADNLAQFVSPVFAHLDVGGSITAPWAWLATLAALRTLLRDREAKMLAVAKWQSTDGAANLLDHAARKPGVAERIELAFDLDVHRRARRQEHVRRVLLGHQFQEVADIHFRESLEVPWSAHCRGLGGCRQYRV